MPRAPIPPPGEWRPKSSGLLHHLFRFEVKTRQKPFLQFRANGHKLDWAGRNNELGGKIYHQSFIRLNLAVNWRYHFSTNVLRHYILESTEIDGAISLSNTGLPLPHSSVLQPRASSRSRGR